MYEGAAVEAAARIICDGMAAVDGPPWNWENTSDYRRDHFRDIAKAAYPALLAELTRLRDELADALRYVDDYDSMSGRLGTAEAQLRRQAAVVEACRAYKAAGYSSAAWMMLTKAIAALDTP